MSPNVDARAVAYLRISHAEEDGRTPEEQQATQRQSIARLTTRHGEEAPTVEYVDWSKSADPAKEHKRDALTAMLRDIESGNVSVVYASSLDRLYRSMSTYLRIVAACEKYGVRVETEREGVLGGDGSPMAMAFGQITATFAELELRTAKARAKSRVARQRAAGVHIGEWPFGHNPGEDIEPVLSAYRETRSFAQAARLLEARGIASRRGHWSGKVVGAVVRRAIPEEVPRKGGRGVPTRLPHTFARLLVCPVEGTTMTAVDKAHKGTYYACKSGSRSLRYCPDHPDDVIQRLPTSRYACPRGHDISMWATITGHPSPWTVPEHFIEDWAVEELRLRHRTYLQAVEESAAEDEAAALRARRERYAELFGEGAIDKPKWEGIRDGIDIDLARLEAPQTPAIGYIRGIAWSASPEDLNRTLRDLWYSIRMEYTPEGLFRPAGAVWRRRPLVENDAGELVPDPDAQAVEGGWYLPSGTVDSHPEPASLTDVDIRPIGRRAVPRSGG
jgi:DNA invertase Pin-like site-specific DNA recombinase